jgi:predicted nucleotidyltransferase
MSRTGGPPSPDAVLERIVQAVTAEVPTPSVWLVGSRAMGQTVGSSDYDVVVVMNTFLVPIYLTRLKGIEQRLSNELKLKIAINPLPTFRLKRARGNLFLFKAKREGRVIYGRDCLGELEPGGIAEMSVERLISLLFSAIKELADGFEPGVEDVTGLSPAVARGAAKAMLFSAELHLMLAGRYETGGEPQRAALAELRPSYPDCPGFDVDAFLADLDLALRVRGGSPAADPVAFWSRAREHTTDLLLLLLRRESDSRDGALESLASRYFARRRWPFPRNARFFLLALLTKRGFFPASLLSPYSVEERLRAALLWLVLAAREDGSIDEASLRRACEAIPGYSDTPQKGGASRWREARRVVDGLWPAACPLMA